MSEKQLRDLLARAVPEAPDLDAHGIKDKAASVRRQRLAAGGGAVAVMAAVTLFAAVGLRGGDTAPPVALDPVPTAPSGSTAPYEPPICPDRLPKSVEEQRTVPDLGDVEAVRLCPDLRSIERGRLGPLDLTAAVLLDDADALVMEIDEFGEALSGLPAFGTPNFCLTASYITGRTSLMFVHADGTTELVWSPICQEVRVGNKRVYGHDVEQAFTEALDQQRRELEYIRPFDGELTCGGARIETPVRPGREDLVAAVFCESYNPSESVDADPEHLDAEQLALLRRAWADVETTPEQLNDAGENECTELDDEAPFLLVGTDRSDVLRLFESPCGTLIWSGWVPGQSVAIPITLADLGIEP